MARLRDADVRFLLPAPAESTALLGEGAELADAWTQAGVPIAPAAEAAAIVAPRRDARQALDAGARGGARSVVLSGWPATAPIRRGNDWHIDRYLALYGPGGPVLYALDTPPVRRYLARTWSRPTSLSGRVRNLVLPTPAGRLAASLSVASRTPGPPYPISAGLSPSVLRTVSGWLVSIRRGDDLQRVVALVCCDGADEPSYAVKFARKPGGRQRGETERRVLDQLAAAAPELAANATSVLQVGTLDGAELTVERAARGSMLTAELQTSPRDRPVGLAERILWWIAELGRRTLTDAGPVQYFASEVLPSWDAQRLAGPLAAARGVLAHQDLGSWDILSDGDHFTVLDWESARNPGLVLADACYFATDVLAELDGPRDTEHRPAWCAELWAGTLPASPLLQRWILQTARTVGVPASLIGPVATACWLDHGHSQQRRAQYEQEGPAGYGYLGRLAPLWCRHPDLGIDWPGFAQ